MNLDCLSMFRMFGNPANAHWGSQPPGIWTNDINGGTMVQPTMIGGVRGTGEHAEKLGSSTRFSHFMILFRGQTWVWSLEWFGGPQALVSHIFCLIHSDSGKMLQRSLSRLRKVRDDLIKQERCGAQSGVWLHRMPTAEMSKRQN